jgi:hypothetical protein
VWETESVLVEKQLNFFSCSWAFSAELNFSWVELLQLQLSFFSWVELQLSWTSSTIVELFQLQLSFLNYSWTSTSIVNLFDHTPVQLPPGQLNWGFLSWTFWSRPVELVPRGGSTGPWPLWPNWPAACQLDWETCWQSCYGRFNRFWSTWPDYAAVC